MLPKVINVSLVLLLMISSCNSGPRNDNYDTVEILGPYITVSQTEAKVGEFIEVKMTAELSLFEKSSFSEQSGEVELGLCLGPDWATEKENCVVVSPGVLDFQPSDDFTVEPEGAISRRDFIVIKRGETVEFSHTLKITANRPGTVNLSVAFESYDEKGYLNEGGAKGPALTFN